MEEKQTLEQLKTELDEFKPSDDPQADATRLAGYISKVIDAISDDRKAIGNVDSRTRADPLTRSRLSRVNRGMY